MEFFENVILMISSDFVQIQFANVVEIFECNNLILLGSHYFNEEYYIKTQSTFSNNNHFMFIRRNFFEKDLSNFLFVYKMNMKTSQLKDKNVFSNNCYLNDQKALTHSSCFDNILSPNVLLVNNKKQSFWDNEISNYEILIGHFIQLYLVVNNNNNDNNNYY